MLKDLTKPLAVIVAVLLISAVVVNLPFVVRDVLAKPPDPMTEPECEADPDCEVVTVYGKRFGHRAFNYMYMGVMYEGKYDPEEAPDDPDAEDDEDWSCEPLLAHHDKLLTQCLDRAKVEYASCLLKYDGLLEFLLGEILLDHCNGNRELAEQRCRRQDAFGRALLPPQCGVGNDN